MSKGFEGLPALPAPEWNYVPPMYGQRQMWAYAQEHASQLASQRAELLEALRLAEAALSDIGDADREEGDDLSWCERRAAKDLSAIRSVIANATQQRNATGGEG